MPTCLQSRQGGVEGLKTMRRLVAAGLVVLATVSFAQENLRQAPKKPKDVELTKKENSAGPAGNLAGDITRKKENKGEAAPALKYDQYRLGVEMQVSSKRHEQIESLKKIIRLSEKGSKEMPTLLFRLGELYWEESKDLFFQANRKDDDLINAMNAKDTAAQEAAKREKEQLTAKSKEYGRLAVDQYSTIVQDHKDFERTDEVLFFLGQNLLEQGDDRKALVAFKRLIEKYPKSRFLPDAHLAFGEYYFNSANKTVKKELLEKALESYKKAASFPDSQVYAFALYKQGWCYFNMANYQQAMDMFKAVILYGEYAGASAIEKDGGKGGKNSLVKEARNDYVRAYARVGTAADARAAFSAVTKKPEDRFLMMKQLANLYYEDGKDRDAALTFNTLIKEKPLSPEAPGFQGKIVDCVLRAGNKRMTVDQVRRLVKITGDVQKSGVIKEEKDKKALDEALELSERTLSNLAVNWHNEARKTRDEETFKFANDVYGDYLTLFPNSTKAYDLRFFWAELLNDNLQKYDAAAEQYTKVMMMDVAKVEAKKKPGKFMQNAAYNAVLAYDEVVKKAEESGQLKQEPNTDVHKKLAIAPQKKQLLEACERYLKYVPNGEKKVEISFKAANIYYRHNYFDEAVARFSDIALNHPDYKFENGERAAEMAANLVLDSYNLLGDWSKVNEYARKFYNDEKLSTGKFRDELSRVIEQSAFKLVNQLEARQEFAKAAEAYLNFVQEFPKSEMADTALRNAYIDFFRGHMLDRSIEVRKRLITQYPKSPHTPLAIFSIAEDLAAIADFDDSANWFERYANAYEKSTGKRAAAPSRRAKKGKDAKDAKGGEPDKAAQVWEESKAQIALFNAATFREGLGQHKAALKNREHYLDLWPESKDAESIQMSIADLYEKMGAYGKAIKALEEYERKNGKDPAKVMMAEGKVAAIYEKTRRPRDAVRVNQRLLSYYEKQPKRIKTGMDERALDAVGKASYQSNEDEFKKFAAIKLKWGRLPSPEREFKEGLKAKAKGLEQIQKLYTQTVNLKSGDPAICALYKIGLAYDNFVHSLVNAPMPRGAPEELQQAIRAELETQALPVKDKAAEAFTAAVMKSHELDLVNDCSNKALAQLRETYRPQQFTETYEDVADLKNAKSQAVGGDVLAAVQPIPLVIADQEPERKQRSDEGPSDMKSGSQNAPPEEGGALNDQEAPDEPAAPPAKKSGGSDEPEEIL
jgi:cellulose synthase operon protein C